MLTSSCTTPSGRRSAGSAARWPAPGPTTWPPWSSAGCSSAHPDLDRERVGEVLLGNANGAGEDNRNVARMAVLLAGLPVSVPASTVNRLCGSSPGRHHRRRPAGRARRDRRRRGRRGRVDDARAVGAAEAGAAVPGRQRRAGVDHARLAAGQPRDARRVDGLARRGDRAAARPRGRLPRGPGRVRAAVAPARGAGVGQRLLRRPGGRRTRGRAGPRRVDPRRHHRRQARRPQARCSAPTAPSPPATPPRSTTARRRRCSGQRRGRGCSAHPLARVAGWGAAANEPQFFGFAPVEAADRALARAGIGWGDVGAVELNEAFAAQSLACVRAWGIDPEIVNAPRRRDRDRPPAGRLRHPGPRHPGPLPGRLGRALGGRRDLHRRRPGPRGRAGERGGLR